MNIFVRVLFILLFFAVYSNLSYAQTTETQAEKEVRLKNELLEVEKQISENEKILTNTQNQTASLKRDILILDTKIKTAQLNIKAKNLTIESLGKDINKKQEKKHRTSRIVETMHSIPHQHRSKRNLKTPYALAMCTFSDE
jgi:septal ring factor EnvC (AmiA/AmiB activator)